MEGFLALYIFMLAAVTGYEIITRVPSILHSTLLSGLNLVHSIVLVGAMITIANAETTMQTVIGFIAVMFAAANAVGGFVVSQRMQTMFKRKNKQEGDL